MEGAGRRSTTPEDRSEGNETLSAPSEYLAEFLSAIMRRQYAEALKYCRLILQYEPHNGTARGFYPLLRTRVSRARRTEAGLDDSFSDEAGGGGGAAADAGREESPPAPHALSRALGDGGAASEPALYSPLNTEEHSQSQSQSQSSLMSQSAESGAESEASAGGDHSELELDSSDALHSSPSLSLSRRTDGTDRTDRTDRTDSASGGGGCGWESSASAPAPDDNGNAPAPAPVLLPDDFENDNAGAPAAGAGAGEPHHAGAARYKSSASAAAVSSLRRLRAHFACSIK